MVLKALVKSVKNMSNQQSHNIEEEVQKFISQGGSVSDEMNLGSREAKDDHRLTLRIPQWLMDKVDEKRKKRVGSISRNLWILEQLEKACKK